MPEEESAQERLKRGLTASRLTWLLGLIVGFAIFYAPLAGIQGGNAPSAALISGFAGLVFGAILNAVLQTMEKTGHRIVGYYALRNIRHVAASKKLRTPREDQSP